MSGLLAAIVFFTRIPIPVSRKLTAADQAAAATYAPLIGWLIGVTSAATWYVLQSIMPLSVAVLAAITAGMLVTGALHEDGLADVFDGFGASAERDRVLEIMRDPTVGVYGCLGLGMTVALKIAALYELSRTLLEDISRVAALTHIPGEIDSVVVMSGIFVAGHAYSRLLCVSLLQTHDYARPQADAKARAMSVRMSGPRWLAAIIFGVTPLAGLSILGLAWPMIAAGTAGLALRWVLGGMFERKLGGYTGDCLGAVQQLTETTFYLVLCAMLFSR